MRRLLILVFVGLILTATTAYAVSENDPHTGHQMSNTEMNNMETDHDQQTEQRNESTMQNDLSSGGHEHGASVPEAPPNYLVLSVFAIVNAGFLLIGVILKWRRTKGSVML